MILSLAVMAPSALAASNTAGGAQVPANAAHLTVPKLRQTLRQDGVLARVRARVLAVKMVRGGARVGLEAIAQSLGMRPRDLLTQVRKHQLQIPPGTTAQTLEETGDAAAANWLKGLAAKHPKLTASDEARLLRVIESRISRLVTRIAQG